MTEEENHKKPDDETIEHTSEINTEIIKDEEDKLSICEVDMGETENYTIVCGAPNVKSGIHVPVAKVGAKEKVIELL